MAKKKKNNNRNNSKRNYEVGYKKPPEEYKWKKGCKSPNPKGRPKKITSIKEALQINLGKEISSKNENGETCKISCADALVKKTLADAIQKDGPTRRMLYRLDLMNLQTKDQEFEYDENQEKLNKFEKKYHEYVQRWANAPDHITDKALKIFNEILRDLLNQQAYDS